MAGSLAHRQKRAETGDVRAEWHRCVGMDPKAAWGVLGMHVVPGNGADGHAQVGLFTDFTDFTSIELILQLQLYE